MLYPLICFTDYNFALFLFIFILESQLLLEAVTNVSHTINGIDC